jgi:hypothetical protein
MVCGDQEQPMSHLTEDTLLLHLLDGAALADADRLHLDECAECRHRAAGLTTLLQSMEIARRSRPTAVALARLRVLSAHIETRSAIEHAAEQVTAWVRARLMLDTRASLQGVRSIGGPYRLLYSTDDVDVELLIEPANGRHRLDGELVPLDAEDLTAALVQLARDDGHPVAETEAGTDGRFRIEELDAGAYRLWVAFAPDGFGTRRTSDLTIEGLEIG